MIKIPLVVRRNAALIASATAVTATTSVAASSAIASG
jgi:hypothetical protein